MRRLGVFAFAAALCLWGCNKEKSVIEGSAFPLGDADVDVVVDDCTKAAKTAWADGDRINIWFDEDYSQKYPDLVIRYNATTQKWEKLSVRAAAVIGANGTLCALYETTNDLVAMYKEATTTATFYQGAAGKSSSSFRSTPMLLAANACSYTYNPSTTRLSATIGGWKYFTRFKVLVKNLPSSADYYALKVYRAGTKRLYAHPFATFGPQKDANTGKAVIVASKGTTSYAAGVQESDGVAFYFDALSAAVGDTVHFGMRIYDKDDKIYVVNAKDHIQESETACKGVSLDFSRFSAVIDGGVAVELVNDGGEVDFEDRPPLPKDEYTLTKVTYDTNSSTGLSADSRTVDGMNWMDKLKFDNRDRWGGFEGVKPDSYISTNSAGYWRTGLWHGKKVFVDPDGNVAFLTGMNCVVPDPLYTASLAGEPNQKYYHAKFGDGESSAQAWARWVAPVVAGNGFNCFSVDRLTFRTYREDKSVGWSISETTEGILHEGHNGRLLSQVENLYFIRTFMWNYTATSGKKFNKDDQSYFTLMFDPDFNAQSKSLVEYAANNCKFLTNKHFVGYFLDNEHPYLGPCNGYPGVSLKEFLNLPTDPGAAGYYRCNPAAVKWAQDWMQETYKTKTYKSSYEKPFKIAVAKYYYSTICDIIRSVDPNHLILGDRLISTASQDQQIVETCADYCDAVSFTFYNSWDIRDWPKISSYTAWTKGKPLLVAEFYVKDKTLRAPDGTLYLNDDGGGWKVSGQTNRGVFYQNACISFIENPNVAGWMHFKWNDDFKTAINGWVNKGIISPDYSGPHAGCTDLMRQLNFNEYRILDYYYKNK